jgi:hypothetical protein
MVNVRLIKNKKIISKNNYNLQIITLLYNDFIKGIKFHLLLNMKNILMYYNINNFALVGKR